MFTYFQLKSLLCITHSCSNVFWCEYLNCIWKWHFRLRDTSEWVASDPVNTTEHGHTYRYLDPSNDVKALEKESRTWSYSIYLPVYSYCNMTGTLTSINIPYDLWTQYRAMKIAHWNFYAKGISLRHKNAHMSDGPKTFHSVHVPRQFITCTSVKILLSVPIETYISEKGSE